ncbi:hypothetical protein [Ralstonia solanacearum]|uniref:hypothetical protein n=1 Tax=Ralstonia solanacearum TaxID=305 RepID=UPI000ADB4E07|nr:hypothetical protein [Ralstonia solanacearum]
MPETQLAEQTLQNIRHLWLRLVAVGRNPQLLRDPVTALAAFHTLEPNLARQNHRYLPQEKRAPIRAALLLNEGQEAWGTPRPALNFY